MTPVHHSLSSGRLTAGAEARSRTQDPGYPGTHAGPLARYPGTHARRSPGEVPCSVQLAGSLPAHHPSGRGPAVQERESCLHHASRPPSAEIARWRLEQADPWRCWAAGLLALAEKLDALNRVAAVAARLGRRCTLPALLGFDHVYADLLAVASPSEATALVRKLDRLAAAMAALYVELEALADLEQSARKLPTDEARRAL
ncbi:hypothetical protein E2562_036255 [Oryza meyeriana var. granulata]|uniref:Uncharacterized protein n=1 Tax=Oryza meyeriana var. granulata TaxID=110450 RepID=A0A6G1CVU8_9ORYZ|nr:hypothetical protein E2562_036255 [Oryza meyeriana var. granulata]